MPELPEVETIKRQLKKVLIGKKIKKVEVLREKCFNGKTKSIENLTVENIERKAKVLEVVFRGSDVALLIHLKMTGQLIYTDKNGRVYGGHPTPDWVENLPSKHTRVILHLSEGAVLYFNDMRVFGWLKVVSKKEYEESLQNVAYDVTESEFDDKYLFNKIKNIKRAIKLVLLDQGVVGGVGNIYVNDALFLAGVDPRKPASALSPEETKRIVKALKEVIDLGIKSGGASSSNYVQIDGLGGKYQDHFLVYKKSGEKCPKCENKIEKVIIGGRGTYYCRHCQK